MDQLANFGHTLIGLLWIILGFGMLIFIHELGHFLAAKWAGIRAEGFAVGMGPVMVSWRKGMGFRGGSSSAEYERLAREYIATKATEGEPVTTGDEVRIEDLYKAGDALGLGETEYSLRWLPIGGFVKMLGQEDANPNYVSDDPHSYNSCPIGKRMIVVSAGVVMNILLAALLFVAAFMVGVRFEAPVIGQVSQTLPAGVTMADNAEQLGITEPGILPGDRVVAIDGKPANTFADVQIASAMSRPDLPVRYSIQRAGYDEPIEFTLTPTLDRSSGLRSIGVTPGRSTILIDKAKGVDLNQELKDAGVYEAGVRPGMKLISANGRELSTYEQLNELAQSSNGVPINSTWTVLDKSGLPTGENIEATINVTPSYQSLPYPEKQADDSRAFDLGLLGMVPLRKISSVDSLNADVLKVGDVILRVGEIEGPRFAEIRSELLRHKSDEVELELLREGQLITAIAKVSRKGMMGVSIAVAHDLPIIAEPLERIGVRDEKGKFSSTRVTPVASMRLLPRTRIDAINGVGVSNWKDMWLELRAQSLSGLDSDEPMTLEITLTPPTPGAAQETVAMELTSQDISDLHALAWTSAVPERLFDAIYTTRSAGGSPLTALTMGVQETKKIIMMTYLTIDRLFRRTVGVEQLRGPVGIMHIGVRIADRGFIYMLFFLGMISVNLAVINFLPLPIVDGGLFLFLIYEKLKGKPPSIAFQNATTIVGLCLIGTIFIVTFYNDVMRLIG